MAFNGTLYGSFFFIDLQRRYINDAASDIEIV